MANSVDPSWLYQALKAQGLPPVAAAAFVSIAGRESGYNPAAHNTNASTGDNSYGLFQINLLHGGWTSTLQSHGMADPASALLTPQGAVQGAAILYSVSGLTPWGGYKGLPWSYSTNLSNGANASNGEVSVGQLQSFAGAGAGQGMDISKLGSPIGGATGYGSSTGGSTGGLGSAITDTAAQAFSNVPVVGGILSAAAGSITAPIALLSRFIGLFDNWRYVLEVVVGAGMILVGIFLVAHDMGAPQAMVKRGTEVAAIAAMAA